MSSQRIIDLRGKRPVQHKPIERPIVHASARRASPVRTRRRHRRIIATAAVFLFAMCAIGGVSYASYLPRFSVQTISVVGAQAVPPEAIRSYADQVIHNGSHHLVSRANIFTYPHAVIEHDLAADFPRIASASVSRPSLFSNDVVVTVTERQAYALWCATDGTCFDMDDSGFIFAEATEATTAGMYRFSGSLADAAQPIGTTFAPGHLAGLVAFLDSLGQAGFSASSLQLSDGQDFVVPLSQGFSVYASFGEEPSSLVNNLKLVLASNELAGNMTALSYVDLRFGDRVYYKLKGEKPQASAGTSSAATSTPVQR